MIIGIGTDITELARIKASYDRFGERFLQKILTPDELKLVPESPIAYISGRFAAKEAAVKALDAGDTGAAGLASYKQAMEDSFVIKDLATFRKWHQVMEGWDAMFNDYPTMAAEVFNAMFSVAGRPQEPLRRSILPILNKRGIFTTDTEVRKGEDTLCAHPHR